ncbi:hypothetical protein [Agrobacterium rubi]|nr:hypothetical protein [Agrobacterium rubi]MBP1880645.1 hypothetical protein [Agrobacterium rubi]
MLWSAMVLAASASTLPRAEGTGHAALPQQWSAPHFTGQVG